MRNAMKVKVRSPFVYCATAALALVLTKWIALSIFTYPWLGPALGYPVILLGAGLFTWGWWLMKRHQVDPNYGPVRALVNVGPYRFSRNPLYLGMSIALLGVGLASNTYWHLLLLPLAVAYMQYGVILPEERHLEKLFGDEYLAYKGRVRRWI